MRIRKTEDQLIPLGETLIDRVCMVGKNLGNVILHRVAAFTAELKVSTGFDATSPFSPREIEHLKDFGYLGNQPKE